MAKIIGSFSAPGDMQIRQMRDCERLPDGRAGITMGTSATQDLTSKPALREMLLLLSCVSFASVNQVWFATELCRLGNPIHDP